MSFAGSNHETRHVRLLEAATHANELRLRASLAEDTSWSSPADRETLRTALQKVSARGKVALVRLLLDHGADPNLPHEKDVPPLFKAAENGHRHVIAELLQHGAQPDCRNRSGQTALFAACLRGHGPVVEVLLQHGADAEAQDKEKRTPLLFMAAEKTGMDKRSLEVLNILLEHGADVEIKDQIGRTPLLWAATNNNVELARILLERNADITACNNRGRTALHLSAPAESKQKDQCKAMVRLLLDRGADPCAVSDGGWTPLHNAAQGGHVAIAAILLEANALVNAELSNGMTPLHWAAYNGREDIVRLLLTRPETNLTIKDSFDRTPMLCAAERYHAEIVQLLSPASTAERLPDSLRDACQAFEATVVDFGQFKKKQLVSKYSIYDVLYGWDHENDKPKVPTLTKNMKYEPDFRWIHLPANNIAWVETLLAKSFIEAGHRDIEGFKALERCFDQEHRGQFTHAHFMRTFCSRISAARPEGPEMKREPMNILPEEQPAALGTMSSNKGAGDATSKRSSDAAEYFSSKPDVSKKKNKSEQLVERHPKKHKRGRGPPGNPPRQDSTLSASSAKVTTPLAWETPKFAASSGKIVLFMPFLHYETDERRRHMTRAIDAVAENLDRTPQSTSKDALLVNAYLNGSTPRLHPRRTLDQFFYHGIDTSFRDQDQVVWRYCKNQNLEHKVFMVDQLWLWIIGKDLIITCFPQRWDQPKQDPLNVLDGIIEETNAKTRPPIESVYDLAMLITSRCSGMFDRHRLHDQNYQFLDMFEHSIGVVTDKESKLFDRFNRASARSAKLLDQSRRKGLGRDSSIFPALLNIGGETSLLAEIKDIRDELNIIQVILEAQLSTLCDFESYVIDELRGASSLGPELTSRRGGDSAFIAEIRKRSREQQRGIEDRQKDILRMDHQAGSLYNSLTDLLDLKQKHSNALEARFAGDQAVIAARQGQTIMVFTIVTIVFLPMSFIASFFAINFKEWDSVEDGGLTRGYVSKYMFGIGLGISIPLIALAFVVTDLDDKIAFVKDAVKGGLGTLGKKKKGRPPGGGGGGGGGRRRRRRRRRRIGGGDTDDEGEYQDDDDDDDLYSSFDESPDEKFSIFSGGGRNGGQPPPAPRPYSNYYSSQQPPFGAATYGGHHHQSHYRPQRYSESSGRYAAAGTGTGAPMGMMGTVVVGGGGGGGGGLRSRDRSADDDNYRMSPQRRRHHHDNVAAAAASARLSPHPPPPPHAIARSRGGSTAAAAGGGGIGGFGGGGGGGGSGGGGITWAGAGAGVVAPAAGRPPSLEKGGSRRRRRRDSDDLERGVVVTPAAVVGGEGHRDDDDDDDGGD